MTTTALHTHSARQSGFELLVSRAAVGMLRWSQHRTNRRRISHEQMMLLRQVQRESADVVDLAHVGRQF